MTYQFGRFIKRKLSRYETPIHPARQYIAMQTTIRILVELPASTVPAASYPAEQVEEAMRNALARSIHGTFTTDGHRVIQAEVDELSPYEGVA